MEQCRTGENRAHPFRRSRFFVANGAWYFESREAPAHGPYPERRRAERACEQFVQRLRYQMD